MRIALLGEQRYIPLNSLNVSRQEEFQILSDYLDLRETDTVCDIGCGDGYWSKKFSKLKNCPVFGIDLNLSRLADAKNGHSDRQAFFLKGDIHELPYKSNSFDKIVSICVLEHLKDDVRALREMRRVIKEKGILSMTVDSFSYPAISEVLKNHHRVNNKVVNYYSCDALERKLSDSGFKLLKHQFITNSPVSRYFYELYIRQRQFSYFLFPLAYPLSIVSDRLFGNQEYGFKLAIKAQAV
jgi:ubiquinone/menaquinone biosynthesis C-methylase UbiE